MTMKYLIAAILAAITSPALAGGAKPNPNDAVTVLVLAAKGAVARASCSQEIADRMLKNPIFMDMVGGSAGTLDALTPDRDPPLGEMLASLSTFYTADVAAKNRDAFCDVIMSEVINMIKALEKRQPQENTYE
jgi:hypothetical protein